MPRRKSTAAAAVKAEGHEVRGGNAYLQQFTVAAAAAAVSSQQWMLASTSGSIMSSAASTTAVVSSTTVSNVSSITTTGHAGAADTETLQKLVQCNGATYLGTVKSGQPNDSGAMNDCNNEVQATSRSVAQHQCNADVRQCGDAVIDRPPDDTVVVVSSQAAASETIGTSTSATSHASSTASTVFIKAASTGIQVPDSSNSVHGATR
eukprot:2386-Heterococcus_DN1.PRE.8